MTAATRGRRMASSRRRPTTASRSRHPLAAEHRRHSPEPGRNGREANDRLPVTTPAASTSQRGRVERAIGCSKAQGCEETSASGRAGRTRPSWPRRRRRRAVALSDDRRPACSTTSRVAALRASAPRPASRSRTIRLDGRARSTAWSVVTREGELRDAPGRTIRDPHRRRRRPKSIAGKRPPTKVRPGSVVRSRSPCSGRVRPANRPAICSWARARASFPARSGARVRAAPRSRGGGPIERRPGADAEQRGASGARPTPRRKAL